MNTKMILEIAGAKPLAEPTTSTSTSCISASGVKGLVAEKEGRAVCEKFDSLAGAISGKKEFEVGNATAYGNQNTGEAAVGELGVGMWRGVFGATA